MNTADLRDVPFAPISVFLVSGFWFLVWSAHWLLPTERRRHWLLLGASFLFYACSDLVGDGGFAGPAGPAGMRRALLHASLLLGFMVIGWGCGLMTARAREAEDAPRAKRWMAGGVAACLLLLGIFKYTGFLLATLQSLLTACALPVHLPQWQPELPVGISFFAFHAVCYFWRRWHVSLSCWLRDYLDIGLGGNRGPMMFVLRNLMLTMLLGGLWHGASWNFVLWGALHGSGLCVERLWRQWSDRREPGRQAGPLQIASAWLFTQSFVLLCWIPFRCTSFADTTTVVQGLFGWGAAGNTSVEVPWLLIFLPLLVDTFIIGQKAFFERLTQERTWLLHAVLIAGFFLALMLMYLGTKPFIYFQF